MNKETTTTKAPETTKELTFFEAVKVLLADDMAKGGFENLKIKKYWGQFRSTWEDESGLHLHTILVYKHQWGKGFDIVRKDEITHETHYSKYINASTLWK